MGLFDKFRKNIVDKYDEKCSVLVEQGKYDEAIALWQQAIESLPEPQNAQKEAALFQETMADAYFLKGEYDKAYEYLSASKQNFSGEGCKEPFALMRFGQAAFELGREDEARDYLLRAYEQEPFWFVEEDPKYLDIIKELIE